MNLFLIENDRSIDLMEKMPQYHPGRDVVICFNYLAYLRLKKDGGGHAFFFIEDLFTPEDYKALHSVSDHFALDWYRRDGIDHSICKGVSYGDMVRITFSRTYMATILLKYGELINKAVKRWPETKNVYHDFSKTDNSFHIYGDDRGRFFNKPRLVEEVCGQLGRECAAMPRGTTIPSLNVSLKHTYGRKTAVQYAKDLIKKTLISINGLFNMRPSYGDAIYFFSYFNINSILKYMKGNFIVSGSDCNILDPRRFLNSRFLQFDDVSYRPDHEERLFVKGLTQRYISEGSGGFLEGFFVYRGIDYRFLYYPVIKDLIRNVIPGLLKYVGKIKKAIRTHGISKIIIFEEIDERFQAVIEACRSSGILSVWMDHGIQGSDHAQKVCDRGRSDLVICTGDFFTEHYRRQGARSCIALGNPCLDSYADASKKRVKTINKVMFLSFEDGFYARLDRFAYQEKYYEEIFSTFGKLTANGIKIFFKPHPAYNRKYFEYLFDFFCVDESNIVYIEDAPFSKVVYDMDLVVSNVTSCFYEAQAAGVPTVFMEPKFNPDAFLPPLNGVNWNEVLRVSSGEDLLKLIMENRGDAGKLNIFLDNFLQKHAYKYMGKLDGMAGSRIVEHLIKG